MCGRVAGTGVDKDMVKVAVRSPGGKPRTGKTGISGFRTFCGVLQEMARELRRRGVTHVVTEASGSCAGPVYHALCEQDFTEVAVISPAHAQALKGRKAGAGDCAEDAVHPDRDRAERVDRQRGGVGCQRAGGAGA